MFMGDTNFFDDTKASGALDIRAGKGFYQEGP